mmetsp:Transcript_33464/g.24557  ORF Transcript_33464/g.24557 Transcript_33464/m.24557 type:complete len:183 (+) Transcript_33464:61-609(+)
MSKVPRTYSDKYIAGQGEYDVFKNMNAEWVSSPFLKVFYIFLVAAFASILYMSQLFSFEDMWTVTNIVHGVVTFVIFHWIKGCPDDSTQGEYNAFTLYEQVDGGTPWTQTKKFLMIMPTVITYIACYAADYKKFYVIVNLGIFFICLVAKLPQMHRVRILGINSTPGIDNPVQLPEKEKKGK